MFPATSSRGAPGEDFAEPPALPDSVQLVPGALLLLERGAVRVQMHAFAGKSSAALPAVEAGFFFSVPPSIVRSQQKQKLIRNLPLECLLVETDSPVLGPSPQERNEPAHAILSIHAIAEIKRISESAVMEAVRENTRRLYGDIESR